jgi:hypothetical protein
VPDGEPELGVELTGVPVVAPPAPEGSDRPQDPGLVDAGAPPLLVVVALELQADVVTGGVVAPWGGIVVVWQTGGVEPASAEAPAV